MSGTNWAGNLTFRAANLVAPKTVAGAQETVRAAAKLRVVGSRHCFNDIADTTDTQLSLGHLRGVVALDTARHQVTVEGGARYSDVSPWLHERGYALHNLASLPHITIAGACATATHGSGAKLGNLATAVAAIEFIDAGGDLVTLSREKNPDTFPGAAVSLGALGVITKLTLDLQQSFAMRQNVYCDLPIVALEAHFDEIMAAGYSVSLFTGWQGDTIEQVWVKSRAEAGSLLDGLKPFFGAAAASDKMHPISTFDPVNCTGQMGSVGPSYDRLPHFRIDSVPAGGGDYQAEYFVAREHALDAAKALGKWGRALSPLLMISEVRAIAADDLWLSPCFGRPCVAFHFSFNPDQPAIMKLLPGMEEILAPFAPVPHWGKLFTMAPETVRSRYEKLGAFKDLLDAYDPAGKFRNGFVDRMIFGRA